MMSSSSSQSVIEARQCLDVIAQYNREIGQPWTHGVGHPPHPTDIQRLHMPVPWQSGTRYNDSRASTRVSMHFTTSLMWSITHCCSSRCVNMSSALKVGSYCVIFGNDGLNPWKFWGFASIWTFIITGWVVVLTCSSAQSTEVYRWRNKLDGWVIGWLFFSPNDISGLRRPKNVKFGTKVVSSMRMMHTLIYGKKVF